MLRVLDQMQEPVIQPHRRISTAVFLALVLAFMPQFVSAQTERLVMVDPIGDDEPESGCTLREAVSLANAGLPSALGCESSESGAGQPIAYRIRLPAYTYVLTGVSDNDDNVSGDLDVFSEIIVEGAGQALTIIDGGTVDRIFHLPLVSSSLTVTDVTLQNGRVVHVPAFNSSARGGAVLSAGTLSIFDTTIANCTATGVVSYGGGIYTSNGLTMERTVLSNNQAARDGGAVFGSRRVIIDDSRFTLNGAGNRGGGLFVSRGATTITDSEFDNNSSNEGGALFVNSLGRASVTRSSFNGNDAEDSGGAIFGTGDVGVAIANSTLTNNRAAQGGGVFGVGRVGNVTIVGNTAESDGGGISGSLILGNSIVAGNFSTFGGASDCFGSIVSQGHNLIGINTGCEGVFPGGNPNAGQDLVGTAAIPLDPGLRPLENRVFPLQVDSSAIDFIPLASCVYNGPDGDPLIPNGAPVVEDQRAEPRFAPCDIGAYEFTALIFASGFE